MLVLAQVSILRWMNLNELVLSVESLLELMFAEKINVLLPACLSWLNLGCTEQCPGGMRRAGRALGVSGCQALWPVSRSPSAIRLWIARWQCSIMVAMFSNVFFSRRYMLVLLSQHPSGDVYWKGLFPVGVPGGPRAARPTGPVCCTGVFFRLLLANVKPASGWLDSNSLHKFLLLRVCASPKWECAVCCKCQ